MESYLLQIHFKNLSSNSFFITSCFILTIVAATVNFDSSTKCSVSMFDYIVAFLIINLLILSLEIFVLGYTCKGNIFDFKPNRSLVIAVYTRLIFCIAEIAFVLIGTIRLIQFRDDCLNTWYDQHMKSTLIFIVIATSLLESALCLLIFIVYNKDGTFYKPKILREGSFNNYHLTLNRFDYFFSILNLVVFKLIFLLLKRNAC